MNKFLSLIGRVLVYRFKFAREHKHLSVVARFCLMGMLMSSLEWLPGRDIFAQTGTVNARLRLISHTYNYPTSGQATLVMVEDFLCTDPSGCAISGCNSATFQLDPILNAQVTSVSLAIPDFGEVDVNTQGTDYRASDGRIRFIYTAGTAFATIPQTGMVMLTATIQYTMTAGNGAFLWFDGLPTFYVVDTENNNITGSKETIPADLTSIPLGERNDYLLWTK